jgi:hypothetical protein
VREFLRDFIFLSVLSPFSKRHPLRANEGELLTESHLDTRENMNTIGFVRAAKMPTKERRSGRCSSVRLTVAEFDSLMSVFKQLSDNTTIKWCIYAAGVAAVVDTLHVVWLVFRYTLKF